MFWLWTLPFYSAALAIAFAVPYDGQLPLDMHKTDIHGVLRRYALQGWNIRDVVRETERANAHIWHASPSHVDIRFERADQRLKLALPEVGSIPISRPEDIANSYGSWDLRSFANSTYHAFYHPLYEIENFMEDLEATYPTLVRLVNLGHSGEGREMVGMKISKDTPSLKGGRSSSVKKTGFVITGAQHAREWIATSTALYLAHSLVADKTEHHALSSWLDYFEFYIIPVPNPDGYVYTWEKDRFWYKNRQNVGAAERCTGIDMNRNWGHKWKAKSRLPSIANATDEYVSFAAGRGADADPCSTWFPGHRPFQAPEVNNIANYITTLPSLKAFIDLRSYGQMLSTPFSWSCEKTPKDAEDQLEAALGAVHAIKEVHGTVFTTGSLCEQLYKASGNVVDYMYAKAGIKYSYSVHLRDTGTYGFSLPAEWIRPVGEETANMVRFLATFIAKKQGQI